MRRDWIGEATAFLQERYNQVCPEKSALRIDPPLDESEAQLFMQGHEAGIFSIDQEGYVQSRLLARPTRKSDKQRAIQMFWHPAPRFLFREGVCQLSTASCLILKYGWSADSVVMEPVRREFGPLAYGVDIVITDAAGQFVCGDVKRGEKELDKLLRDFRSCCGLGPHSRTECPHKDNHPKYDVCSEKKALYFFATCPGREVTFKLLHNGQVAVERELEGLIYPHDLVSTCEASPI